MEEGFDLQLMMVIFSQTDMKHLVLASSVYDSNFLHEGASPLPSHKRALWSGMASGFPRLQVWVSWVELGHLQQGDGA